MIDLTRKLHESFCEELNNAWLGALKDNPSFQLNIEKFEPIRVMISEAKGLGYEFIHGYDTTEFLSSHVALENEIQDTKASTAMKILNHMIGQCSSNGWDFTRVKLTELKRKKLNRIIEDYASTKASQHGPFYTGEDLSIIHVYGLNGDVGQEMILLCLIFGYFDLDKTKNLK
jgi:hypothetical protein